MVAGLLFFSLFCFFFLFCFSTFCLLRLSKLHIHLYNQVLITHVLCLCHIAFSFCPECLQQQTGCRIWLGREEAAAPHHPTCRWPQLCVLAWHQHLVSCGGCVTVMWLPHCTAAVTLLSCDFIIVLQQSCDFLIVLQQSHRCHVTSLLYCSSHVTSLYCSSHITVMWPPCTAAVSCDCHVTSLLYCSSHVTSSLYCSSHTTVMWPCTAALSWDCHVTYCTAAVISLSCDWFIHCCSHVIVMWLILCTAADMRLSCVLLRSCEWHVTGFVYCWSHVNGMWLILCTAAVTWLTCDWHVCRYCNLLHLKPSVSPLFSFFLFYGLREPSSVSWQFSLIAFYISVFSISKAKVSGKMGWGVEGSGIWEREVGLTQK